MKLNEQIGLMIKEVDKARYPEDKEAYEKICGYISDFKNNSKALDELVEIIKQIDNIRYMMHCYLPKKGLSDPYGNPHKPDNERSYNNLAREKKKLLASLHKLKCQVETIKNAD